MQTTATHPPPNPSSHVRAENERTVHAFIYRMLAELLGDKPDEGTIRALRAPGVADTFEEFGYDLGLASFPDDQAEAADKLAAEHTWVFVGPMNHVPPFGSIHRPEEPGELWGKSTQRVYILLKGLGLEPSLRGMIPDHISVELDLMAHLCTAERTLLERGETERAARCRQTQRMFLDDHLLAWLPFFARKVAVRARLPVYRELTRFAVEFLTRDRDALGPRESMPTEVSE